MFSSHDLIEQLSPSDLEQYFTPEVLIHKNKFNSLVQAICHEQTEGQKWGLQ